MYFGSLVCFDRRSPYPTKTFNTPNDLLNAIAQSSVDLSSGSWVDISHAAKNLVGKMLHIDPKQRYKASDILRHPFLLERSSLSTKRMCHGQNSHSVKEEMLRIFKAIAAPPSLSLDPVVKSNLAKRRANRRSANSPMIVV